ncbi:hypothetical protein PEXP_032520 [Penicillium expansum]|nr:hypothetical protein PEXP_032520 [Penicillium expansum]
MTLPELPIWYRTILLILAIISFLPQFLRIQTKHSITGISSFYILCNLISITEQFTFYYYLLFNEYDPEGGVVFLHDPPSAGDWFSLCQTAVVSLLFLGLCEYPPFTSSSIFLQARQIYKVPLPNALSVHSLAMQAVVFMLVAVAWIWSVPFEYEELFGDWNWTSVGRWYVFAGWVIVDAFVFALGQAALLVVALRRSPAAIAIQDGETQPLLG